MISADSTLFGHSLARRRTRRWLVGAFWGGLVPLLCVGFQLVFITSHNQNGIAVNFAVLSILWITIWLGGVHAGGGSNRSGLRRKFATLCSPSSPNRSRPKVN